MHAWISNASKILHSLRKHFVLQLTFSIRSRRQKWKASKNLGPKVKTVVGVFNDLIFFMIILTPFLFGFGVASQSVMYSNEWRNEQSSQNTNLVFDNNFDKFYKSIQILNVPQGFLFWSAIYFQNDSSHDSKCESDINVYFSNCDSNELRIPTKRPIQNW